MQIQFATRIESKIKRAVEKVCESRGLKINRFIEDALIDKLEELEDIEDLKRIGANQANHLKKFKGLKTQWRTIRLKYQQLQRNKFGS